MIVPARAHVKKINVKIADITRGQVLEIKFFNPLIMCGI